MTYWDGWERMRFNAAAVEPGAAEVATRQVTVSIHKVLGRLNECAHLYQVFEKAKSP